MIRWLLFPLICRQKGHNMTRRAVPPFCLRCHRSGKPAN